jgi:hypothetical protein
MRADATAERVRQLLARLGRDAEPGTVVYLAGGASAVLYGWRDSTRDVDLRIESGAETLLRAIAAAKDELDINIELAGPLDFLPAPSGWESSAISIGRFGALAAFHTPFALQALAKLERDLEHDACDVSQMLALGLTTAAQIRALLDTIEPQLYRTPAVDPARLRAAVDRLA